MFSLLKSMGAWLVLAAAFMQSEMLRLAVDCTGAITNTTVLDGTNLKVVDIEATTDGDTQGTITHNFGAAVLMVIITPMTVAAGVANWYLSSNTATLITVNKNTAASSGQAGNSVRVFLTPVHSINR